MTVLLETAACGSASATDAKRDVSIRFSAVRCRSYRAERRRQIDAVQPDSGVSAYQGTIWLDGEVFTATRHRALRRGIARNFQRSRASRP